MIKITITQQLPIGSEKVNVFHDAISKTLPDNIELVNESKTK